MALDDRVDAGFAAVRLQRALARLGSQTADPDFWRGLCPDLTITDRPPADAAPVDVAAAGGGDALRQRMRDEGYAATSPIVPPESIAVCRDAVRRLDAEGLPAAFVTLYDEPYRMYAVLDPLIAAVLGPRPVMRAPALWAFHVPAGSAGRTRWTTFAPHRDYVDPDPRLLRDGVPGAVVAWIALTDVTPADSCLYVLPADCDPDYRQSIKGVTLEHIVHQDVRAVPAAAGSVVLLSTRLVHWGSRSSRHAAGPRISLSTHLLRRGDATASETIDLERPVPFAFRRRWLFESMRMLMAPEELARWRIS